MTLRQYEKKLKTAERILQRCISVAHEPPAWVRPFLHPSTYWARVNKK